MQGSFCNLSVEFWVEEVGWVFLKWSVFFEARSNICEMALSFFRQKPYSTFKRLIQTFQNNRCRLPSRSLQSREACPELVSGKQSRRHGRYFGNMVLIIPPFCRFDRTDIFKNISLLKAGCF